MLQTRPCLKNNWTNKNNVLTPQIVGLISHRISDVSTLPATPAGAPGLSILLEITTLAESHMSVRGKGFKWLFKVVAPSGVCHICTSFSHSLLSCRACSSLPVASSFHHRLVRHGVTKKAPYASASLDVLLLSLCCIQVCEQGNSVACLDLTLPPLCAWIRSFFSTFKALLLFLYVHSLVVLVSSLPLGF